MSRPTARPLSVVLVAVAFVAALVLPSAAAAKDNGSGKVVNVMTRNVYLGANLAPAIGAPSLEAFVAANGQILREVTANDFPTRAKGLAQEILAKQPDLVGLQEVALWR